MEESINEWRNPSMEESMVEEPIKEGINEWRNQSMNGRINDGGIDG